MIASQVLDKVAHYIGAPSADAAYDYLVGKTDNPQPVIAELTLLGVPPANLRKILVRETVAHWPHTLARLKMLFSALYEAGLVDSKELTEELPADCGSPVKP